MASIKQLVPLTSTANRVRTTILIVGDACVFVIFAAVGRASHHEASGLNALLQIVLTAAPFAPLLMNGRMTVRIGTSRMSSSRIPRGRSANLRVFIEGSIPYRSSPWPAATARRLRRR